MTLTAPAPATTIAATELRDGSAFIHGGERAVVDRVSEVRAGLILDIHRGADLDTILVRRDEVFARA